MPRRSDRPRTGRSCQTQSSGNRSDTLMVRAATRLARMPRGNGDTGSPREGESTGVARPGTRQPSALQGGITLQGTRRIRPSATSPDRSRVASAPIGGAIIEATSSGGTREGTPRPGAQQPCEEPIDGVGQGASGRRSGLTENGVNPRAPRRCAGFPGGPLPKLNATIWMMHRTNAFHTRIATGSRAHPRSGIFLFCVSL